MENTMEGPGPQTVKEHSPTTITRILHATIGIIFILLAAYCGYWLLPGTVTFMIYLGTDSTHDLMVAVGELAFLWTPTAFFGLVGFRLISGRGAKAGGGLLSPIGYRLLGVVLALLPTLFLVALVIEIATEGIHLEMMFVVIPLLLFGIPSVLCFVAAHRRAKVVSQGQLSSSTP
jgi:hypothetical protein